MSATLIRPKCAAIILAAGSSRRMGFDKLAAPLAGMPVLRRTVGAFLLADSISSVVLVCPEDRLRLLDGMTFNKPFVRVDGGADRQDSVANGLAVIDAETSLVAVHDGARPLISAADINRCVEAASRHHAASLARRATETMKRSDPEDFSTESVCREHLWCMETPQAFDLELLTRAYRNVASHDLGVTDEVSAVQSVGAKVKFIASLEPNPKITTSSDLALAEALLALKS